MRRQELGQVRYFGCSVDYWIIHFRHSFLVASQGEAAQIRIAQRYKQAGVEKVRVRLSDDAGVAFQLTGVRCVWRPTSIIVPPIRILCNADRPDLVVTGRV